ncbi:hypothetical protein HY992_06435 [Candidatus Micrarchaeota archaeon]|nr:hypothetical protein [Candidatus Micrarchaeota archaeon]
MIHSSRIDLVKAKRSKEGPLEGIRTIIDLDELLLTEGLLQIKFVYTVEYEKDVASILLQGSLFMKEDKAYALKAIEQFKKNRALDPQIAEVALSAINFLCSADATLVAHAFNLRPPMLATKIIVQTPANTS